MRTQTRLHAKPRPLNFSLARLSSAAAVAAALLAAGQTAQAQSYWFGTGANGAPGDGFLWTNPNNWTFDTLPIATDDLVFDDPLATPGTILLNGNQTANSLTFTDNYTLGAYGTKDVLTNAGSFVTVNPGVLATINAAYGGTFGLNLSGGGTLFLNNPAAIFGGSISVDGAGTTLLHRQEGPTVQYNGVGSAQEFGRFDQVTLGYINVTKTITLSNGGEYKIINAGNNPEGNFKNINIGSGGGTLNLAAGYIVQNLDDVGQLGFTTEAFTKAGKGRLIITGNAALSAGNPLQGVVNINGGMISLDSSISQTVGANTYVRYLGIGGVGTTLNVNSGGTILLNSGANVFDVPVINMNDGSIFAVQGGDAQIGYSVAGGASSVTTFNINGTTSILARDLFGPQTERLPRLRADLAGSGTLVIVPNTNAGGNPRLVIERNTSLTGFTGTFRLNENMAIEANPRNMNTIDTGKVLGSGDVDFAGWASRLDVRDSTTATSVFDYTANDLTLTSTQAGSVPRLVVGRATAATGTGSMFNFGTLTMGSQRLGVEGNNNYQVGVSGASTITGNSVIEMRSDNTPLVFSNAAAISENGAGRSLTLIKTGVGNAAARDVISGGAISLSNLEVATGSLMLRGASGAITTGFGGAAPTITVNGGANNFTNGLPSQGLLHLDSNTGHVVGATTVFAAANNNNRIDDSATLNMRSNSTLRLTSANNIGTTEIIGTTNVAGHATFDIVKTGAAASPVALRLAALNIGPNATANFTGTALGTAGNNTSRIVIGGFAPAGGVVPNFMGSQYHQGNEWAKYDNTVDSGFEIGVTPFVAANYVINPGAPAAGQHTKYNGAAGFALAANANTETLNLQFSAVGQAFNLAGFGLRVDAGGILVSTNTTGFVDGPTNAAPSGTAGITSSTPQLYFHNNAFVDIRTPIAGAIDFVKSGTGTLRLTHQGLGVGTAASAINPFTATPWASTLTGSWIVNDGRLEVHRGTFLGGRPVVLNGGHLEINEPVSVANDATILPGWGNDIIVNGNATVAADDNGESADANTGDRALVKLGSLTINNGSIFGTGSFSDSDMAFMGGATINGRASIDTGIGRAGVNSAAIINGVLAGSGFDVVAYNGGSTLVIGGTQSDTTSNTYNGSIVIYGGSTVRLNKANTFTAITDGAAAEDVVINGGSLFMGPGQHGDLVTNNQAGIAAAFGAAGSIAGANNYGLQGIAPTSPAAIKNAGMNQIADTATITLLSGTLGESDRITNETFGALIMKNGTFNVGLGTVQIGSATFSGGALGFDRGGTLRIGTASYLPGAFDQSVFTGRPSPGAFTTLEYGAGGVSLTGQNITIGNGFSGNVAGAGGRLLLGGNLTFTGSDLIGGSYGRKGIFVQTGSTFRELGASHIDLMGGVRDFNIAEDSIYTITPRIINGGISKSGGGALVLEPYERSLFAGPITVNGGILQAKGDGAFGTSAGGVTINVGGTVKLDSSWTYGDDFTVAGPGSIIPGSGSVREAGALIAVAGTSRLNGAFVLGGNATLAGDSFLDPSTTPATGGLAYRIGTLLIAGSGGVTGTGTLNLSGHGDGIIRNGVNTSSGGLIKDGAGRWTIAGPSTYAGVTEVRAGTLRVADPQGLGSASAGTVVYGGATLELVPAAGSVGGNVTNNERTALGGPTTGIRPPGSPCTITVDCYDSNTGAFVNSYTVAGIVDAFGDWCIASGSFNPGSNCVVFARIQSAGVGGTAHLAGNADALIVDLSLYNTAAPVTLMKEGAGKWTLGGGSISGSTHVGAGTLEIASASQLLDAASGLSMGGGNLAVSGAAQTVNGLNLLAGGGTVSGGAGLTVGAITRSPGATAKFAGNVRTSTANTNDILGGYATVGSDWATVNGSSQIVAYSGYHDDLSTALSTDNARNSHFQVLTVPVSANSLKLSGGSGLDIGASDLNLVSGGLLHSSSLLSGIAGTGFITAGNGISDELVVTTTGGTLDIATPLVGNFSSGGLTKTGNGKLVVRGSSNFSGPVNINGGTLSIVGPGGTTHPTALGTASGPRSLNINGGTFEVVGGDYNSGATNMYYVIGSAGATVRSRLGAAITIDDGNVSAQPFQLSGPGDLTFTGGGRYGLGTGGQPNFPNFTGKVTVDGGILSVGNGAATGAQPVGSRQDQTITLKAGSAIINNVGFGFGLNGLVNNIVAEGGVEFFAQGGSRVYSGDIQLSGTNTIALMERDNPVSERQMYFNGRVSGTGITLNVFGIRADAAQPFYLTSGSNNISGNINLNTNAVLEVRTPGSLGLNTGDMTVNLNGVNSKLFLRHFQNGDYRANVVVNETAEINSDRLAGFAGGGLQILSINDLTLNGDNKIVTIGGGNTYHTRVAGTATFNAPTNTILNVTASDLILENGLTFGTPGSTLDKRGGFTAIMRGPTNHTGKLIIQGGVVLLQDNGSLAGTSSIELRGGELRVDNSAVVNPNRINDGASITLGGGTLRITGAETIGTVTAVGGTTIIVSNPSDELVPNPLTLTGFTRAVGSVVQFQSPDVGAGALAVGQNTNAQTRVGSRIFIPGQANTTQTIPGFIGNNSLDFIQYNGTTIDSGFALGVQDMRNPGNVQSPQNYSNDTVETAWTDAIILRRTNATDNTVVTDTLTASRALDAIKVEPGGTNRDYTIALGANNLRIEGGGIVVVNNTTADFTVTGTGVLTAGPAVPGITTAELFIGGNGTAANGTININAIIGNNGTQPVALVKTGVSQLNLNGAAANTYSGGTYVTAGTVNVLTNSALGSAGNQITLSGGILQFNVPNAASSVALGGLGQNINVNANSQIILDNGALAGSDNDLAFGGITINGPYTLLMRGFDSMDATFTGTHTFTGTPTLDLAQAGSGSNPNTAPTATVLTLAGPITGSGFFVSSSGNTNDSTARLQIGGGAADATANTYSGKVTLLAGLNSEDFFVELNKAAGTTAINGDLQLDGGKVIPNFDHQIADTSNITMNWGGFDFNGKNETVASITQNGGFVRTNFDGVAASNNTVNVTGDYNIFAGDDFNAIAGSNFTSNSLDVGSNSTLVVGGTLRLNGYSRAVMGASAANLVVGGLEMTGNNLTQGGAGSLIRLNGDVTTFASSSIARLGNTTVTGAQIQLNGVRTFNIADGSAGLDLSVSTGLVDSTAPVAAGGLIKTGAGTMQLEGSSTVNNYTGLTRINAGTVVLFKNVGINALGDGSAGNTLTIGDGVGGAKADQVIIRNSQQIADSTDVTIASSGLLDMSTFSTTEIIGNLAGAAGSAITLGPTSTLTVTSTTDTIYSGSIEGGGVLTKEGPSTLYFDGSSQLNVETIIANTGTLNFDSDVNYASVIVSGVVNFGVDQNVSDLIIADGAVVTIGDLPGPPPAPFAGVGLGGGDGLAAGDVLAGSVPVQGVPEPGTAALLLGGILTMLGIRRRRA